MRSISPSTGFFEYHVGEREIGDRLLEAFILLAQLLHLAALHRRMGSRGQPEESRAAILEAAAQEFADYGIAGARTEAIAREARVNKVLLYYYFKDKESLYGAVLDEAFRGLKTTLFRVLDSDLPTREKMLAYAGAYFDFVASNQLYPRLMQREMMRARDGHSPHIDEVIKNYIRPIFGRVGELMKKGIADGDSSSSESRTFRPLDGRHDRFRF